MVEVGLGPRSGLTCWVLGALCGERLLDHEQVGVHVRHSLRYLDASQCAARMGKSQSFYTSSAFGRTMSVSLPRRFGLLQATALNMRNMAGMGPFITIPS